MLRELERLSCVLISLFLSLESSVHRAGRADCSRTCGTTRMCRRPLDFREPYGYALSSAKIIRL